MIIKNFKYKIYIQISIWTWSVQLHGVETPHNISMWIHYIKYTLIWNVNLHGVWRHSTLHNIHMNTNMDKDTEHEFTWIQTRLWRWSVQLHGVWRHFIICKCRDTTWIIHPWLWIWKMNLYGMWRHAIISIQNLFLG